MELGMIGLGRMGNNMVRRLLRARHQCVVYDICPEAVQSLVKEGAVGAASLEDFVDKLSRPRALWMMVPAAAVDPTLKALVPLRERDDVVIDGGNSYYHDDIDESAPAPVISAALYDRFSSRGEADFADKVLSAMRYAFGGHVEKAAAPTGGAR
jgi:6-phosphogluconate dehydrogenase